VDNSLLITDCLVSYNAVTNKLGQAIVRGMVVNGNSCDEILERISWLRTEQKLLQVKN